MNAEGKKENTVSFVGVHRVWSGRARKMCSVFSPVCSWNWTRDWVTWGRGEQNEKTKDAE